MVIRKEDAIFPSYFEPARLKGWTLDHHLMNQRVRLICQEKGGNDWINGDRGTFLSRFPKASHRPDGLITFSNGAIVAIETERSIKTRARYIKIICSHLAARSARHWHYAFYILPDEQFKVALVKLFDSIQLVVENGATVPFDERLRKMFRFLTLDELERSQL